MATIDKSSVREEVTNLKAQFEQLGAEGKMSSEAKVLFSSLLLIVDLILSIFLERQTRRPPATPVCRHRKQKRTTRLCQVAGEKGSACEVKPPAMARYARP